jgi:D-glycero-D-manno-heptose 1,7-bisphosphate phosphatase
VNQAPRRAVFLDRDGTLIRALLVGGVSVPPRTLAEVEVLPGVAHALEELKDAGFLLIVVTNQPDVARGTQRRHTVDAIHAFLARSLPIDDIACCYHDDADRCQCRKPLPGMLVDAATRHHLDLASSFMVGDRWRDIEAGRRAGCTTVKVGQPPSSDDRVIRANYEVQDLREAAQVILRSQVSGRSGA